MACCSLIHHQQQQQLSDKVVEDWPFIYAAFTEIQTSCKYFVGISTTCCSYLACFNDLAGIVSEFLPNLQTKLRNSRKLDEANKLFDLDSHIWTCEKIFHLLI